MIGREVARAAAEGAVAIVGIGCRLPGGLDTPAQFWDLLVRGEEMIGDVPPDRFDLDELYDPDPSRPGKLYARRGGFLDSIDTFDASFFGISPREARRMDPQHRLLLEVSWEALEDGGQPPHELAGSDTGVFIGISGHDYAVMQIAPASRELIDAHINAGSATSIAANRISYLLDLNGPSLCVDTACSSALTAVHMACTSLRNGECGLALAGAVNALITPEPTIGFCKAKMLSPEGRCRPFDAGADGYVRSEGAGAVLLKPLARALDDEDPVYAVIRATGVNQDGRTVGLTVPSSDAQAALISAAMDAAGVGAGDVDYIEAHGTGTPVGDPREAAAIGDVMSARPADRPCLVGSVKGNVGHLEAAAGIVGLIKAALALKHRQVPASINFEEPNPEIAFEEAGLRVPTTLEPWPTNASPARAGVNSFGFGGANAHALLEEAPVPAPADPEPHEAQLLALSARDAEPLRELARAAAARLGEEDAVLRDVCFTAAVRRSHHEHRLAAVARTTDEMAAQLDAFVAGEPSAAVASGRASQEGEPKTCFVFSGMGPQWWGMGADLMGDEPAFRAALEECDALLQPVAGWSLFDHLHAGEERSRVTEPYVAHPANFALQVALAALWRSWGIVPDAVVGHSSGEMAAACVAGGLALPDAVRLAFHRGRLQHRTAGSGGMLAAGIAADEVEGLLAGYERRVSLAAVNGPASVSLSGERDALTEIARRLAERGRFQRMLPVTVPYHGPQMDALRDELVDVLAGLDPKPPSTPFVSTVTAAWQDGQPFDAGYWWRNVRQPVRFADAIDLLLETGYELFVELSPSPVLAQSVLQCIEGRDADATVLPSLRRGHGERATMLHALAELHVRGRGVDWRGVFPRGGRHIRLPSYPWQRHRHWIETPESGVERAAGSDTGHPLLGRRLDAARPTWEVDLGTARLAYLDDHRIEDAAVFPAAAYVEIALAAAGALRGEPPLALERLEFRRLLRLADRNGAVLQCFAEEARGSLEIHSARTRRPHEWTSRFGARFGAARARSADIHPAQLRERCTTDADVEGHYAAMRERHGLGYSGAFRSIVELGRGSGEALARLELHEASPDGYAVHPALLDGALQVLGATASESLASDEGGTFVPVSIARVELRAPVGAGCWTHAALTRDHHESLEGDVALFDDAGDVLLSCQGVRLQRLGRGAEEIFEDCLYEEHWAPAPRPGGIPPAAELSESIQALLERRAVEADIASYYDTVEPALSALARAHARDALAGLSEGDVDPRHVRFHARLAELAAEAGSGDPAPPDALLAEHPLHASAFELVRESGTRLAATLRGEEDAREWLIAGPSLPTLIDFYAGNPAARISSDAAAEAIALAHRGRGSLRILEVGAGTGGTTDAVLERLPADSFEYLFTDVSPFFLRSASERFARAEMRTRILDLEDPPPDVGPFDVVLAADVVHATADVAAALRNLRGLLAPGGMLVLVEGIRRSPWLDLVFGQFEGWWHATDTDLRPDHPLLTVAQWTSLLEEAGFAVAAVTDDQAGAGASPAHAVMIASAPAEAPEPPAAPRHWLVLTDRSGIGPEVAAALRERGHECTLAWPGEGYRRFGTDGIELAPASPADWSRLLDDVGTIDGVLHLWALDAPDDPTTAELMEFEEAACGSLVSMLAALGDRALGDLWAVTAGSQAAGADIAAAGVPQSPLWGLVRVLRNERGGGGRHLADLGTERAAADVEGLVAEIEAAAGGAGGNMELAFREGRRLARELRPASLEGADASATRPLAPDAGAFQLSVERPGALESLQLRETALPRPGPGEVAIRGAAVALNFRDVLVALGIDFVARGEDARELAIGWECAGVVSECGEGVEGLRPGDEVIAIAGGSLGSHAVARAACVVPKPARLSFEEAVTLPVAFLTADYALHRLARVQAGERVLVHAASGGVGLAAIQLARLAGAEVFASAGTPEKRAHLEQLGVELVTDSRSLAFADDVLEHTEGEGVDVILNSLAGEAIPRGLEILRPYGRFVELGKRDFYEDSRIGLEAFARNISFFGLDLFSMYADRPELVGELLSAATARIERGETKALPYHRFDLDEADKAFRLMSQARHIGKVVLSVGERAYPVAPLSSTPLFRADGTYLITGGLGGFSLACANWMVGEGAGNLALVSRSGAPHEEDRAALDALRATGVNLVIARADVSDPAAVERVLADARETLPPLRGVFHAAMVLDDCLLGELDYERFERVLAPKVAGAWNLHAATAADELDLFVLFSSISAVVGHPAQANYAAANAFLGALATHRRALGMPALAVDWGMIGNAGYVARHGIEERLGRHGLHALAPAEACNALGELIRRGVTRLTVSRMSWDRGPDGGAAEAGTEVAANGADRSGAERPRGGLAARLAASAPSDRREVIERYLAEATARILETTPERIELDRRLPEMGIDSLMAVELRTAVRSELGVEVPIVDLLEELSLRGLGEAVLERLGGEVKVA